MRAMTRGLIAYFRDCLAEDGGDRLITDLFAQSERGHVFFRADGEQTPGTCRWLIPEQEVQRLRHEQSAQRQERRLMAGLFVVSVAVDGEGSRRGYVRAPLLIAEALVSDEQSDTAAIEVDGLRYNSAVLDALAESTPWVAELDPEQADADTLARVLASMDSREYADNARGFPRPRSGARPRYTPAGVVWLSARSPLQRSVLFELERLAGGEVPLSPPLRQLLGEPVPAPEQVRAAEPDTLPASLTHAQQQTLQNAASQTLSVINGPPGTGKTYTLSCLTVDRVMRGESVLIVCSNEHAADVVRGKLDGLFGEAGDLILRAGRGDHRKHLLERLDYWLSGEMALAPEPERPALLKRMDLATRAYRDLERRFRRDLRRAELAGARTGGLWAQLRRWWASRRLLAQPTLAQQWQQLQASVEAHQELARHTLEAGANDNLATLLRQRRHQLSTLSRALRSRSGALRQDRFDKLDWSLLTSTFPVWVVSAHALSRSLPVNETVFDLVVMDEATQCNLPLALPALQRARRAVVVGDPKQLRHFSFLARDRQQALAIQHGVSGAPLDLDYRERSLLDYALDAVASQEAVAFLDEHFRSHPALIRFSNAEFYSDRLKVLTRLDNRESDQPLRLETCPVTLKDTVNLAEVDLVMARLQGLVEACRDLPDDRCPQIGVVAMSRALATVLENRLLDRFELATLGRHNLRVGTPYAFQGEERDFMLVATGVYPGRSAAAWRYLERPDVFNVAVTRVRHRQWLFVGEGALDERPQGLLARYVTTVARQNDIAVSASPAVEALRRELVGVLEGWGARCELDYVFAGQSLDLLVRHAGGALAIDVIGVGEAGEAWQWQRYRLLERAGLALFPVSALDWSHRRDAVLEQLQARLALSDAEPVSARPYHSLRWRLQVLEAPRLQQLLGDLEQVHGQVLHWLDQRFLPTELTYQRYHDGVEQLQRAALAELEGACVLLEGIRELDEDLDADIDARLAACRAAVEALSRLGKELALLRQEDSGLQGALDDVLKLADRVSLYQR